MKKIITMTIRWDADKKRAIEALARRRGIKSVNKLVNSWADTVIAQEAAETSFRAAARRGNPQELIDYLESLNAQDRKAGIAGTQP